MFNKLPPMALATRKGLIHYKESLLNLEYSTTVSRMVDCIDLILEADEEAERE